MDGTRDLTQKQTIQLPTIVKEIGGPDSRILEFIASTETPDRSNDIVDVAGWVLDNYIGGTKGSNPVFAWSHDYNIPAIGKTISAVKDLRAKALVIRVKFPTIAELCSDPAHPSEHALFVDTVYNLYKSGTMSAVSVGFRGLKYKTRDDASVLEKPEWMRGVHFMTQELLEVSAVVVPANQEALIQARGLKSFNGDGLKLIEKALNPVEENEVTTEELKAIEDRIKALEGATVKTGAKFSATTKADLGKIHEGLGACHAAMKAIHKSLGDMIAEPEDDKEGTEATTPGAGDGVEKPQPNVPEKAAVVETVKELDIATASLEDVLKLFKEAK